MQGASLQQRGGSLKHLPKHPLRQKSSRLPESGFASFILEPYEDQRSSCYNCRLSNETDLQNGSIYFRIRIIPYSPLHAPRQLWKVLFWHFIIFISLPSSSQESYAFWLHSNNNIFRVRWVFVIFFKNWNGFIQFQLVIIIGANCARSCNPDVFSF